MRSSHVVFKRLSLTVGLAVCLALALGTTASAQTGGATAPGSVPPPTSSPPAETTPAPTYRTVPGRRAKLIKKSGKAIPPADAPLAVQHAIIATNQIRKRPYRYGGGHGSFYDTGYDCSGTVSYMLYAAGLLSAPMPSGSFMGWESPGKGDWITIYANKGHMYAVVAGLRLDTSAYRSRGGKGPRWRPTKRPRKGFAVRHVEGF